ncbi:MAG: tRNA lysidine(34) synthetase TilS [Pirellulaceae bacterium]|nr:tRNA lysidine(34) synthetase TilS [Pirellulaceae bacterium]
MDPDDLTSRFLEQWPDKGWLGHTVVVAVSGGADSVALVRILEQIHSAQLSAGKGLVVAHLNHSLREDSKIEEQFVKELAGELGLQVEVGVVAPEVYHEVKREGIESIARKLRYDFLVQTARSYNARYLVTAHHRQDQVETALHHFLRGTGLRGLAGIRPYHTIDEGITLWRPLLNFDREEIRAYLATLGQEFREDLSNEDCTYTRNRLRHKTLPYLCREHGNKVEENILRLAEISQEYEDYVVCEANELFEKFQQNQRGFSVEKEAFLEFPPLLRKVALRRLWQERGWPQRAMTFEKWNELATLGEGEGDLNGNVSSTGAIDLPGGVRVEIKATELVFTRGS